MDSKIRTNETRSTSYQKTHDVKLPSARSVRTNCLAEYWFRFRGRDELPPSSLILRLNYTFDIARRIGERRAFSRLARGYIPNGLYLKIHGRIWARYTMRRGDRGIFSLRSESQGLVRRVAKFSVACVMGRGAKAGREQLFPFPHGKISHVMIVNSCHDPHARVALVSKSPNLIVRIEESDISKVNQESQLRQRYRSLFKVTSRAVYQGLTLESIGEGIALSRIEESSEIRRISFEVFEEMLAGLEGEEIPDELFAMRITEKESEILAVKKPQQLWFLQKISHGDLSSDNILVSIEGQKTLIDFDTCRILPVFFDSVFFVISSHFLSEHEKWSMCDRILLVYNKRVNRSGSPHAALASSVEMIRIVIILYLRIWEGHPHRANSPGRFAFAFSGRPDVCQIGEDAGRSLVQ